MVKAKEIIRIFGNRVRQLRKAANMSQEELAHRAGLHRTYIGMIERGEKNITLSNLIKVSRALGADSCLLLHMLFSSSNSNGYYSCNICVKEKVDYMNAELFENSGLCKNECDKKYNAFKILTENSFDPIHVIDKYGIIVYENSATERVLGYKSGVRKGLSVFEFVHPDDLNFAKRGFDGIITNDKSAEVKELRLMHYNGDWLWFEVSAQNFLDNPYINGIIVNSKNITERKITEKSLQEMNASLEELNRTKDKFFSIISHDLRSSFQHILGYSRFLAEDTSVLSEDDIKNFSTNIYTSTKNTLSLLDNLLKWTEIQQGKMVCNPEFFCILELLENCLSVFRFQANDKGITFSESNIKVMTIFSDRAMLEVIIRNLLSNAIKFSNNDSEVILSIKYNSADFEISISDNGTGMDENEVASLFKIGKIKSKKGTSGEKGTGVGLLLCKDLSRKLGGTIKCESKKGQGSTFTVKVPYASKGESPITDKHIEQND